MGSAIDPNFYDDLKKLANKYLEETAPVAMQETEGTPTDPNFTYVGLFKYIQPDQMFEAMAPIWRCDRCAALVENIGRRVHLEWHLKANKA